MGLLTVLTEDFCARVVLTEDSFHGLLAVLTEDSFLGLLAVLTEDACAWVGCVY
jgi:hypothetical protein